MLGRPVVIGMSSKGDVEYSAHMTSPPRDDQDRVFNLVDHAEVIVRDPEYVEAPVLDEISDDVQLLTMRMPDGE